MSNQDFNQNGFPRLNSPFVQENRNIEIPWYRLLITLWNRSGGAGGSGGTVVPTGIIMDWAGPPGTIPAGWLLCNGLLVSRAGQSALFNAIGTAWGAGDGFSTFALPNLVGRYRKGTDSAVGSYGGATDSQIALASGQLPAHAHGITDPGHTHVMTDPGHVHAVTDSGHAHGQEVVSDPLDGVIGSRGSSTVNTTTVGTTANANTGLTVNPATTGVSANPASTGITGTLATGSGALIDINPANALILPIIKA